MALARTHSVALVGVEGHLVEIEADIAQGLPATILVGLPDTALREARDRIRAAIVNTGESWPRRRSPSGCPRPACPSAAAALTWPSRLLSSRPRMPCRCRRPPG